MSDECEVRLEVLGTAHGRSYVSMIDEFEQAGEGYPYNDAALARADFERFIREVDDEAVGIGLPPGIPPQITSCL